MTPGPRFAFMVRIGRLMATNRGIFWHTKILSKNRKIVMWDYFCIFTGKRQHRT